MALTVFTYRFTRDGFNPQTGRPIVKRELIRFKDFGPGDVINVSRDQGEADEILAYVASKLGLATDQLEIAEWRSFWQIRHMRGEVI